MLRCYITEKQPLWARSTMTTALTSILRVLSRMLSPEDLSPVRDEIRKFHYTPSTDFWLKTVDVAELLALGMRICDTSRSRLVELRDVKRPYRSLESLAERYRNGLMILTLGLSALRVTNFSELAEGTTFVDEHGRHRIKLAGADVKNRSDIRLTLAQSSRAYFDDYLGWIRALIVRSDGCKALWPSYRGDALSVSQIQRIITGVVEDEIGLHVTCHDFRRSAASSASMDAANPSDAPEIVIGDRNRGVVDRHYLSPLSTRMDALNALAAIADDCDWQG
jgi:integrase